MLKDDYKIILVGAVDQHCFYNEVLWRLENVDINDNEKGFTVVFISLKSRQY